MAMDTAFYAAGQILPGPSSLPADLRAPYWNSDGSFGGWLAATAPAGSGTELQYRASSSAFGAVTGTSFIGGALRLPNFEISQSGTAGTVLLTQVTNDTVGFILSLRKTRGVTEVQPEIVTGDAFGVINFSGHEVGDDYVIGAQIRAISEGTIADGRVPGKLVFATGTDAAPTVLTDRMTIDSAGAVNVVGTFSAGTYSGLPVASAVLAGIVSTGSQTFAGTKTFDSIITGVGGVRVPTGGNGFWFNGGGFFFSSSSGVFCFQDAAGTSFGRLQLGGTTSSFPSIKRSSATVAFRLADDSDDCAISSASGTLQGNSSTSSRSRADWTTAAIDNTDATRKYRSIHQAYDTAAREYARGWGDGSVGRIAVAAPASAPTDAHLAASQISFYLDETGHNLLIRAKYADGTTLKLATIALA